MPLTFQHHQLKNGLDIVAEVNPDSYSFAAGLFVKTGSRDEDITINGASHFLEHMMFKGSEKGPAETIRTLQRDQMHHYCKSRYGPGNMVLAVTGQLEFDQIVKLAEKYMGDWPTVNAPRSQPLPLYKPQKSYIQDAKLNR